MRRHMRRLESVTDQESRRNAAISFQQWWMDEPYRNSLISVKHLLTVNLCFNRLPEIVAQSNKLAISMEETKFPPGEYASKYRCSYNGSETHAMEWANSIKALFIAAESAGGASSSL